MEKPQINENCAKGLHVSSKKNYGIGMRHYGEIVFADICDSCEGHYMREPLNEAEKKRYEEREEMFRARGFNV